MTTNNKSNQKGKVIDVSASTVFDLKAELFRATDQFEREKRASTAKGYIPAKKSIKKTNSVWSSQNRGVVARNAQDARATSEEAINLENSRKALERKAQLYNKLKRKQQTDDNDTLLVDFERKRWESNQVMDSSDDDGHSSDDSSHNTDNESEHEDQRNDDPDAWVDYTDEFGRTRTVRRRDLPVSNRQQVNSDDNDDTTPGLMSEDMRREKERLRWEEEAKAEINDKY